MTTLWDTTGTDVVKALAAERRSAGALAFGLALTLVVVVDEKHVSVAESAATTAAAAHPCRLLIIVRRQLDASNSRLDAEVSIGGRLGPGEAVVMRMYGRLGLHAESVVLPLLAPDAPVVTWWDGEPPDRIAYDPLGVFADRRVSDVAADPDPVAALRRRAVDFAPGDTDLAWTRLTGWRTLIAAAFDSITEQPRSVTIAGSPTDPSVCLLSGWLADRLHVPVTVSEAVSQGGPTGIRVDFDHDGELTLTRQDTHTALLRRPGRPDRALPLPERGLGDLLAEELRRLDNDAPYADALSTWSGIAGLASRPAVREHVWRDPVAPKNTVATAAPDAAGATDNSGGGANGADGNGAAGSAGGAEATATAGPADPAVTTTPGTNPAGNGARASG
ncbi:MULTISPECIES: glucose-6-phosphate dehydrogenase assembly protein OpcA [Protofrankia]|uniref:Glucose-6-phosphate dehydrogenase n=1 Tax=Protofrankia coriariae TaxID=1562887 RepID=A0ABR5F5C7_9ACTN|nr:MULTISPECIES: glucose-6-phosphate dehydrogenase assembly protein OpcA [Protofrankia]KLL11924.1 glucose-6-phosphate dehydrogenase [Protofrankia coriariae]ONH36794.1 glucose-6-phosphate dehydrogenase [Protofrankia sp. BMG5.30]